MNFFFQLPFISLTSTKCIHLLRFDHHLSLKKVPFFRLPSVPTCPALSCFYPVYMLSCTSYYLHLANIKFSTLIWAVVLYTLICNLSSKWVGANFVAYILLTLTQSCFHIQTLLYETQLPRSSSFTRTCTLFLASLFIYAPASSPAIVVVTCKCCARCST